MYDRTTAGDDKDKPVDKPIDNKSRQDWNDYIDWLDKKGLKGSPLLDKGETGMQMIDMYRKENPTTSITRDSVVPIQKEFSKYRDYALQQVDKGQVVLGDGVTKDNFLRSLSKIDGVPGQRTTSYKFPLGFMKDMNTNEVKNKGFMTTDKPVIDQITAK